jgi:catechol 2,3-dioxygenase-like lactoylglutathione lyase family enzyme
MNLLLEVVQVPVSDVDRAKAFYTERLGFNVDHDTKVSDEMRIVQLTPPGSACSIVIGRGLSDMDPGSVQGLQLIVSDLPAAHSELVERGLELGEIQVFGERPDRPPEGPDAGTPRPSREGDALDNVGFAFFSDPDGNGWALQQISARGPG